MANNLDLEDKRLQAILDRQYALSHLSMTLWSFLFCQTFAMIVLLDMKATLLAVTYILNFGSFAFVIESFIQTLKLNER